MKRKILWPLTTLLFVLACGPSATPPADTDAATRRLIQAIEHSNGTEITAALASGARADAQGAFGSTSLHVAADKGDASLVTEILNALASQKNGGADLSTALALANKQGQSALELATLSGQHQVVETVLSFCEARQLVRTVVFPVIKKLALAKSENLALLTRQAALKPHIAQLLYETIGTPEGHSIMRAFDSDVFLAEFAKAYLLALESSKDVQDNFFKVAAGFRIVKRAELIGLMREEAAKDLYRSFEQQIIVLTAQFGIQPRAPESKPTAPTPAEVKEPRVEKPVIDETKLPVDQNAVLREAVAAGNVEAMVKALEAGARLDAVDANAQNVYHIAVSNNRSEALTFLLSQLQCSNAHLVLAHKDKSDASPFAIAANSYIKGNEKIMRSLSEFLLSGQACQSIAKKEVREWIKAGQEAPVKNAFAVFSEVNHGIEVLTDIVYRLMAGEASQRVVEWVERSLCQEARDHLWARVYFKAVLEGDEIRKGASREVVKKFAEPERQQVVGFMLFLSAGSSSKTLKPNILNEVEQLQLPKSLFEGSNDGIAEIKATLDEIVTGQENAKVSLAVAIKNHYSRVEKNLRKSNILILGPSGTGKTLLVQTIAKKLDVPFSIFDATNITQAGYVGGKAADAVAGLAEKGEYDKKKIERGIIFLDEIDKMASRSGRADQDEFKRQGQASLLKLLEGIEVEVEINRQRKITIDTKNILFVCAGAFTGLKEIIEARLKSEGRPMSEHFYEQAMAEDLIKYGLAPEMLGRLPNVITLRALTVADMVNILNNPKASVLEEYREMFNARGIELKFTEGAILAISERAVTYNVGARALRTVAESVMSDLQFRIGHMGLLKTITVTERQVRFGDMPTLEYKTGT